MIEFIADLGSGKTTLVQGIAKGMGCQEQVTSPTFTISQHYRCADNRQIHHYDFYRLPEAGLVGDEFSESINDNAVLTVVEWSKGVAGLLPKNRLIIEISSNAEDLNKRIVTISIPEEQGFIADKLKEVF